MASPSAGSDLEAPHGEWLWKGGGSWKAFETAVGSKIEYGFIQFRDHGGPDEVAISGTRVVDLRNLRQMRTEDRSRTRPVRRVALPDTTVPVAATSSMPVATTAPAAAPGPRNSHALWLWSDRGVWKPYSATVSTMLEDGHRMGEETVDIDTERYVDLSSMHQCRRDDPRRRRKVRRGADGTTSHIDALPSPDFAASTDVSVRNVTIDTSTATTGRPASGAVSGSTDQPSGASPALDQAKLGDSPRHSRQSAMSAGATARSSSGAFSSSSISSTAVAAAGITTIATAASASADSDDDMDKKLKARMARFAAKKQNRQQPTSGTAVPAYSGEIPTEPDRVSEISASTVTRGRSGARASTSLTHAQEDEPTTLDLPASNDDQMEASAALSSSPLVSPSYTTGEDRTATQRSLKRKASAGRSESTASSDVMPRPTGIQSSLSDFFKQSPATSSRPLRDSSEDHLDNSLSGTASSAVSQSWSLDSTDTQRSRRHSHARTGSGIASSQGSHSHDTGDDHDESTSAPAPKKRRKLPGWMTGEKAETKPKAASKKKAQTIATPNASPEPNTPSADELVYIGLRTPQKNDSAPASGGATAGGGGQHYSEGKGWNDIKAGFLDMLAALERSEKDKGDITRAGAYSKAANSIRDHEGELKNGKEARTLKGIGPKIAAKFDEFLEKGSLGRVERDRSDPRAVALQALNTVSGVGPVLAKKLLDEHGVDSVAALVAAVRSGKVSVNNDVRVGLKHHQELSQRIPRKEMESLKALVEDTAGQLDHELKVEVLGSYRRGAESSGDVDCLITHPRHTRAAGSQYNFVQRLVGRLRRRGFLIDDIVSGETKYMGVCRLNEAGYGLARRIDIMGIVQEEWACAVTYFTGSGAFNRKMRQHAVEAGYTLNEHALCPVDPKTKAKGTPLPIPDERSLFTTLQLAWVEPSDRELGK